MHSLRAYDTDSRMDHPAYVVNLGTCGSKAWRLKGHRGCFPNSFLVSTLVSTHPFRLHNRRE